MILIKLKAISCIATVTLAAIIILMLKIINRSKDYVAIYMLHYNDLSPTCHVYTS